MNDFSKNNWTIWLIGLLVILNVLTLATLWLTRGKGDLRHDRKGKEHVEQFFANKLDLSEEQTTKFKALWDTHFEEVRANKMLIRELREQRMSVLIQEVPDNAKLKALAQEISTEQSNVEELLSQHYFRLKALCTEAQQKTLGEVFHQIIKKMNPERKRRKRKKPNK